MGGGDSRFEKRAEYIDDLNSARIQFLGGDGFDRIKEQSHCPADKMVLAFTKDEEPGDIFKIQASDQKATDKQAMLDSYEKILNSIKEKQEKLQREFKRSYDKKAALTGQKYLKEDAESQLENAVALIEKLFNYDASKKEGEEGYVKLEEGEDKFTGWENFPLLCLKLITDYPYLYDLMQNDTIKWEFSDKKKKYKDERYLGCLSAMTCHLVREAQFQKQNEEYEQVIYFSGRFGKEDFDALMELVDDEDKTFLKLKKKGEEDEPKEEQTDKGKDPKEKEEKKDKKKEKADKLRKTILFPGVTYGYYEEKNAMIDLKGKHESKQEDVKKIIFQVHGVNGFAVETGKKIKFMHRLLARIVHFTD